MEKKTLLKVIVMPLLFMLLFPFSGSAQIGFQRGDVFRDNNINIRDVTALVDTLLNGNGFKGLVRCDVNGDLKVNISDVTSLVDYLLTGELTLYRYYPPVPDNARVFTVNGVSFAMMPVEGGWYAADGGLYNEEKLLHDFYIGQTEVTRELWEAVMGEEQDPSLNFTTTPTMPVTLISWQACQDFIVKLNELTGIEFGMPTYDQWQYAALGGRLSQGYTYAGSDNLDEVAWYNGNWPEIYINEYITYIALPVGLKKPNELGLYDMSGNMFEWVYGWPGDGEELINNSTYDTKYMLGGDVRNLICYCEPLYLNPRHVGNAYGNGGTFRLAVMASALGE